MHLKTVLLRLLQSRFGINWFRDLAFEDRIEILSVVWSSGLNRGLDYRERYLLLRRAYENRRMKNFSLLDSEQYARIYAFFRLMEDVKLIEGDVVECGVGRGLSLACLVYATSFLDLNRVVYAFDSFSGFPEADLEDLGSRVKVAGEIPSGWTDTSPDLISTIFNYDRSRETSLLRERDVHIEIVPGYFERTLPEKLPPNIAFLHVDCDLYGSTKLALQNCLPRMSRGGIVILDEYHDAKWPGAKKATDEICADAGLKIAYFDVARRYGLRIPI